MPLLVGVFPFGMIYGILALDAGLPQMNDAEAGWTGVLIQCLKKMVEEPALYLMVRKMA